MSKQFREFRTKKILRNAAITTAAIFASMKQT